MIQLQPFWAMLGTFMVLPMAGFQALVTVASLAAQPQPPQTTVPMSPVLKVIEEGAKRSYQLHVMDKANEVEVICHHGTKPVLHNHDGSYTLHCEK